MPDPIVTARDITKVFGSKTALDAVSVDVFPGDIVGVLGKNGAGKTTLLETLLGFSPATRRAPAIERWRRVDWLRLRPLPQSNMFRDA